MANDQGRIIRRANSKTIHDKFLVGYQGWFTCAGDGEPIGPGHHGWLHWFNKPLPDGGRPNTDLWPDLSEYSPSELYPAPGLKYANGDQAFLFSSRHPKTVQRHFHWMALHGVDGALLQRFLGQCDLEAGNEGIRRSRDEVGDRVREAAEQEGRVFAIMYDVSGVAPDRIQRVLENDWIHLLHDKCVLDSPNYLKEQGRPVVVLWGFGFNNRNHSPAVLRAIIAYLRSVTPGGAYIVAGAPAHWRTSSGDADRDPEFLDIWLNEFDAISPWTVGRYGNEDDADRWGEEKIKTDAEFLRSKGQETGRKVDYMPVVLPGGSGYNLSQGKWSFNGIKRNGGHFLWKQIYNARRHGVRTLYGAMWDEYDEGTAFMPVVSKKSMVPVHDKYQFMALDEDGHDLPSDWYMRICGLAAEGLRGDRVLLDTFPIKELQDYWSTRPRFEESSGSGAYIGGSSSSQTYQGWLAAEGGNQSKDEPPPPPYSVEAVDLVSPLPAHSQHSAPPPNLSSKPSLTAPAPPRVALHSRPSSIGQASSVQPESTSTPQAISMLADDFSQQMISSPSRPPHSPGPSSHPPMMAMPAPPMSSTNTHWETSPPGAWSQVEWPPKEWNIHSRPPVPLASHPGHNPNSMSYSPSRTPTSPPPAPPLTTKPSVSGPQSPSTVVGDYTPQQPQPHQVLGAHAPHQNHASTSHPHSPAHLSPYDPPAVSGLGHQFPQVNVPQFQQVNYEPYRPSHQRTSSNPNDPTQMPQSPGSAMYKPPSAPPRNYGPPPPRPRPSSSPSTQPSEPGPAYPNAQSSPLSINGGALANRAWSAVDRVAGQDKRKQLEKGVETLAQTGSKLFNKYKRS
ncbi:hypothetical protein SERLA73DRAFT_78077 [Serpula lacrymans var. lacrymans S7.3]|uniref:Xylosidase/arabinosidase n=1 Tax=Serpula lacrymans var. lacrymans (strain S7.3) TaxID=936435 RepID=F8QC38_SERL3|nr:hypothetical protein SERLA73DRAFT_78077 [Serpula lacrymans var. lacrymans S7.3]